MKINPVNTVVGQYQKIQTYTHKDRPEYSAAADKLELSDQAKLFTEALAQAKKTASASMVDKQARIEEIRAQISDASYSVDAREIAKKMLMV